MFSIFTIIATLTACGPDGFTVESNDSDDEDDPTLKWEVEILGACPSTETLTWAPPENTVTVSVRTDRTDGMTVWTAGSQVSTDEDGIMVIPCAVDSDIVLTYAIAPESML